MPVSITSIFSSSSSPAADLFRMFGCVHIILFKPNDSSSLTFVLCDQKAVMELRYGNLLRYCGAAIKEN
ncbi:hypothetical protein BpHYR1_021154 [Brachionus plicatilis]|uniref:Uncharacterized protein n=1 Tax=Brachionus plicatilis TaxID=10195 RepID=A0A3M7PN12_BRAPC|nr:hypothetical protein BpHYR1_021154 [Brachionus plicatilis]